MDDARVTLLRLLLVCVSDTMYTPVSAMERRWIAYFVSRRNPLLLPFFCSLLNTVCAYEPVDSYLPYGHMLFKDAREPLVLLCAQMLCVMLDYEQPGGSPRSPMEPTPPGQPAPDAAASVAVGSTALAYGGNTVRYYVSRIHRPDDFQFILLGLSRLLNNPLQSTYLPHSIRRVNCAQELQVLLWWLCHSNGAFLHYLVRSPLALDIIVPIVHNMVTLRRASGASNPNAAVGDGAAAEPSAGTGEEGAVLVGAILLLVLSGDRNFCVRLNKHFSQSLSWDLVPFVGNHADMLLLAFYKIVVDCRSRLTHIYETLLMTLVNVAPFIKSLGATASERLLHLFETFSSPHYLLAAPQNHRYVAHLVEFCSRIIEFQFDGSAPGGRLHVTRVGTDACADAAFVVH